MTTNDARGSRLAPGAGVPAARVITRSEAVFFSGLGLIIEQEVPVPEPATPSPAKMSARARDRLRRLRRELSASFGDSWGVCGGVGTGASAYTTHPTRTDGPADGAPDRPDPT